jgi:hypothetical protein
MRKILGLLLIVINVVCAQSSGTDHSFDYEIKDGDFIRIKLVSSDSYIACVKANKSFGNFVNFGERFAVVLANKKLGVDGAASLFKIVVAGDRLSDGCSVEFIPLFVQRGKCVESVDSKNAKLSADLVIKSGKEIKKRIIIIDKPSAKAMTIFGVNKKNAGKRWDAVEFWSPALNLNIDGNICSKNYLPGQPLTLSKTTTKNYKKATVFQIQRQSLDKLQKIQESLIHPLLHKILKSNSIKAKLKKLASLVEMVFVPIGPEAQNIILDQISLCSKDFSANQNNLESMNFFLERVLQNNNFCSIFESTRTLQANVESYLSAQAEVKKTEMELQEKLELVEGSHDFAEKIKLMQDLFSNITRLNHVNFAERMLGQAKKILACKDDLSSSDLVSFKNLVDKILDFKWNFAKKSRCGRLVNVFKERKQDLDFCMSLRQASMAIGKDQLGLYKNLLEHCSEFDDDQKLELAQSLENTFESRANELKMVKALLKETKHKISVYS